MGMRKSLKSRRLPLAFAGAFVLAGMFATTPALAAAPCPNETSRVTFSAKLPDCRVYEWVTRDSNYSRLLIAEGSPYPPHSTLLTPGTVSADGSMFEYALYDPAATSDSSNAENIVVAKRGPDGWSSHQMSPKLVAPAGEFLEMQTTSVSNSFTEMLFSSDQPYPGSASSPAGHNNIFLQRADGTVVPLSKVGGETSWVAYGSPDYSHFFFVDPAPQLPSAPANTTYEWADGELKLLGIEPGPGQVPMTSGVTIEGEQPTSNDGQYVLFLTGGIFINLPLGNQLFLREHGDETVDVSQSQRTVEPESEPPPTPTPVGVSGDGSEVLFISTAKLTNDAKGGGDLYSYDVATGKLSDLTAELAPAVEAGVSQVDGFTNDMSYIYFTASGNLAPGAVAGQSNLYVLHEGTIRFVAAGAEVTPAGPYLAPDTAVPNKFYITPDGRHVAFTAKASLTGYDNMNPKTGTLETEAFEYTYGGGVVCASCRPNGTGSTGAASLATGSFEYTRNGEAWTLSNDGSRMFFQSTDAILPQASNDLQNVYEYEDGEVHLISPGDSDYPALLVSGSPSGEDVFIGERGELAAEGSGLVSAIYDARVDGVEPAPAPGCSGEGCQGPLSALPAFGPPASTALAGAGNLATPAPAAVKKAVKKVVKCVKGKKLKHGKCVKTKSKKKARKAKRSSVRKGAK